MSSVMQPPPEYHSPPYPNNAPVPGASQQPRKPYRWVWIPIGILALVCVIGSSLLIWHIGSALHTFGDPTIVSDQYYTAIRDHDYARAYSFLGSDLTSGLSQETFTQQAQQQDATYGSISKYWHDRVPLGEPAVVTLTVIRADETSYTVHLEMRPEGDAWKITSFDRI